VSEWCEVTSGVPQGSVLGPLLFVVFINDMPECVTCECKMYADDSKLFSLVRDKDKIIETQKNINSITEWTKKWLMRLNADKCKVMHLGKNNQKATYKVEDVNTGIKKNMSETESEKDLGVYITSDLDWSDHAKFAASKANRVLGMLTKTFVSRDKNLWKKLYVSLVRPHLEYASQVWNPRWQKDKNILEKVQRRASRIPLEFKGLEYEDRIKEWDIQTLEDRRTRGRLIQMYKIKNKMEEINWYNGPKWATRDETSIRKCKRNNKWGLEKEHFNATQLNQCHFTNVRKEFFPNIVVDHWNALPDHVIEAPDINSFKAQLDKFGRTGCYSSQELR